MSSFDVESLFQSIDIILTQRLNALSYDTTVIATIVDDSDKDKGHYIVSDDTIKFDAYTTDATYKTGEQVRVTVINGDWSQKKFIEGKYSDKEADEKAVTYIPPLGTTLQSNLSQIGQKSKWTLYTNGETYAKDPFVITIPEDSDLFNLQNKGVYDVLTIATDISTDLGNLSAGNYGLRLDLLITPESGFEYRIQKFITFDSSEMLGNPYNFIIDSHQEKRIAIADLGHVTEIVLTPYQGVVIADDGTEAPAPFLDREGNAIGQLPIYFKNVVLGFGSDLAMLEDNSLKLYTPDLPFYDYNGSFGSPANHKRLGLIWCNKTETNEYIGFSDGIVDIDDDRNIVPYDEIEYLKASNFDERLVAQTNKVGVPSDKTSLTLAANIADAIPLMKSAYENLTTGLSQVLQRFNGQIVGATSIQEELKPLIFQYKDGETQYPPKLVQFKDEAKEKATLLEELYTNILQYGYNTEKGLTPNDWNGDWGNTDYYILFKNIISAALGEVADFLNFAKEETATGKVLSGYRRIYNDYEPKINAQIKLINTYIDQIPIDADALTGDLAILKNYQTKTDYVPYVKEDFSEYANRYCIYWYRYNEGYKLEYIPPMSESEWNDNKTEHSDYQTYLDYCENNNIEYKYRNFLGDNWERLTIAYDLNEADAVVNPRPLINFGLPNTVGETVAAVTYFPPAPAESQILTRWLDPCTVDEKYQAVLFYNHEMVKSNIVVFANSEEVPPRFKVNAGDVLRIEHDIDSREHYQVYSSANDLLNISDGSKTRQLKCFYDGVLTGDETLADAEIYWYIPVNSTMLTYDKKFLVEKQGFSTDIDGKTPYSKDGYVYFNKKIGYTRTEEIMTDEDGNEMYDSNGNALRETVITINSEDRFFFYKIKSYYESSAQNNTILVYAYVPNKEEPTVGEINFTFGTFGSNGTKYTLAITPATDQIAVLPAANTGDDSGNLQLNLTLYNANSEKLDMTTGVGDSTGYYNLTAEWYASSTDAPALGEIKNIENSKSKFIEALGVLNTNYDTNKYAGIIKASVSYQGAGVNEATDRVITLSALYSIPYASSEDLYISGPTSIIYNSQGTVSRLSEEPYCLYQHTLDGDIKVDNQVWSIAYYDNRGNIITEPKVINYLPRLLGDNTLQPSPMYCDYGDGLWYVPVAICKINGDIVWTQPIIITQNAYESSMLNDWNGGLQIDESNATIMATMIGAGKKESNNSFSGVLMGDVLAGADLESGIGLHGFHYGQQSFNFGVDGKAFLGKVGRGRIIFDGDDGIIKSATTKDDSGMTIDLDDAWIEVRGPQKSTGRTVVEIDANPGSYGAYFSITSEWNNKLIHIGQNNYYLKSDNYSNLGANDDIDNPDGLGMKIDLNRGRIDAYNFRLNSKNVLINSSNTASSYLSVKDDSENILFNVGPDSYYLRSSANNMDIDLNTGLITADKFILNARKDSKGIYLNSDGDEYFWIGNSQDNYISLWGSLGIDIRTQKFELNAWTKTGTIIEGEQEKDTYEGIYINSSPKDQGESYYFRVGSSFDNYIQLDPTNGLDIRTTQFELDTPTLVVSSNPKPYILIRTGKNDGDKDLAYFSKERLELMSAEFNEEDVDNDGLKIDISNKKIQFGNASMLFETAGEKNHVTIDAKKSTIGLTVTPRMYSPQLYIDDVICGGNSPYEENVSITTIDENNYSGGSGGISLMSVDGVGNRFPSQITMENADGFGGGGAPIIKTNWSIDKDGKAKGIKAHDFTTNGRVLISAEKADKSEEDPWFTVLCPAYIGEIGIENNQIFNKNGASSPITFTSQVEFKENATIVYNTEQTVNDKIIIQEVSRSTDGEGEEKITVLNKVELVARSFSGYNPIKNSTDFKAPCLQIIEHLAVDGIAYAPAFKTDNLFIYKGYIKDVNGINRIVIKNNGVEGIGNIDFNDGSSAAIINFNNTGSINFIGSEVSFSKKASFNGGANFAAGYSVNFNGGVTFHTNPAVIRDGSPKTLGALAFADEVKKKVTVEFSDTYTFYWKDYYANTHSETLYEKNGDEYTAVTVRIFDGYDYDWADTTVGITATASEEIIFTADGEGEASITSGTITVSE